jgi:hypothetical protein
MQKGKLRIGYKNPQTAQENQEEFTTETPRSQDEKTQKASVVGADRLRDSGFEVG